MKQTWRLLTPCNQQQLGNPSDLFVDQVIIHLRGDPSLSPLRPNGWLMQCVVKPQAESLSPSCDWTMENSWSLWFKWIAPSIPVCKLEQRVSIGIPAISSEKITCAINQEPSGCVSSALPLIDLKVARADGEQSLISFQPMDTQLANDDQRLWILLI